MIRRAGELDVEELVDLVLSLGADATTPLVGVLADDLGVLSLGADAATPSVDVLAMYLAIVLSSGADATTAFVVEVLAAKYLAIDLSSGADATTALVDVLAVALLGVQCCEAASEARLSFSGEKHSSSDDIKC